MQNYKNNKGHTTHNEYNANTITTATNIFTPRKYEKLYRIKNINLTTY
jgi:hypothetical protein